MIFPGHPSSHQRRSLGLRLEPLTRQKRARSHGAIGRQERPVRHRPLRHSPPLLHHASGSSGFQEDDVINRKSLLRRFTFASAARSCDGGLRRDDALEAQQHLAKALHRVHRLPVEGQGHVHDGARRRRSVRAARREHEAGLQGQEEAGLPRQGEIRLTATISELLLLIPP